MKKERNTRPARKMKPVFLVFCEGETEETYINFLRQKYRIPIKVISYITGLSISPDIIKRHISAEKLDSKDTISSFLMYDLDREDIIEKLAACKESISITSNPTIELWFLLHNREQHAEISTDRCIEALQKAATEGVNYEKGTLSNQQKMILWDNRVVASGRAKKLPIGKNPSSSMYLLIDEMERIREKTKD
jgi:hypothetical protein